MSAVNNHGCEVSYRVFGEGARDLVLVHGWMVSGAVYDSLVSKLSKDYRVIVPDFCGTGNSSQESRATLAEYVDDLRAVLDDAGAGTVLMVGNSMGGQIAQLFAAKYPERVARLALLCTVPTSGMELPPDAHGLFFNSGKNRDLQSTILGLACTNLPDEERERMLDDSGKIPVSCIQQAYTAWTGGDASANLGAITARTLVVGTDDPFLPHDFLKAAVVDQIPNAEFAYLAGCGHYPQNESPQKTAELLEAFFDAP